MSQVFDNTNYYNNDFYPATSYLLSINYLMNESEFIKQTKTNPSRRRISYVRG